MQEWWRDPRCHLGTLSGSSPILADRSDLQAAVQFILKRLRLSQGATVLDLCCGPGRYAIELAERGLNVIGIDVNEDYVALAKQVAGKEDVRAEFLVGDMREIPYLNHFDAVINVGSSFGFFEAEADDQKVLKSVARALKPQGRFLLEMGNRDYLLKNFESARATENADGSVTSIQRDFDFVRSRINTTFRRSPEGKTGESWSHSWRAYTLAEVVRLLTNAELDLVETYGGWQSESYDVDARRMVVISERRAA